MEKINLNKKVKTEKPKYSLTPQSEKKEKILNPFCLKNYKSKICCHGRPTLKDIQTFKEKYFINYVLTLFNPKENPFEIQKYCLSNDIHWEWIEISGANYLNKNANKKIIEALLNLYKKLKNEEIVLFVHCAAGIHRTGTIIYTLLRMFGETEESSLDALGLIRKETKEKVGKNRIDMAERNLVKFIFDTNFLEN